MISKFVLPNKERIQNCLEYLHDKQYRYLTFLVQYVMNFFDSCVKQINELVSIEYMKLNYRLQKSPLVNTLNNTVVCFMKEECLDLDSSISLKETIDYIESILLYQILSIHLHST